MYDNETATIALGLLSFMFVIMMIFSPKKSIEGTVTIDHDNIDIEYIPSK